MIFSGVAQSFRCRDCQTNYSDYLPTSILPLIVVVVVASKMWSEVLWEVFGIHWLSVVGGIALAIVSFCLIFLLLQRL
ncbi:MAG: hypothetical protein KDD60_12545, partial [Bdellovibrionales bacterium]|nr:hypothetical protein [Bdellovibrionales bacterium]